MKQRFKKITIIILIITLSFSLISAIPFQSLAQTITETVTTTYTTTIREIVGSITAKTTVTETTTSIESLTTRVTTFETQFITSITTKTTTENYYMLETPGGSESLVIYLGSGSIAGQTVRTGGLNQDELEFAHLIKRLGLDVTTPTQPLSRTPTFPLILADNLGETRNYSRIYLIGWSAGGIAAAWSLIEDENNLIEKGVIANTILKLGEDEILNSYKYAGRVNVPHLLVWGETDDLAVVGNASAWTSINPSLSRLELFEYGHSWFETPVRSDVESTIIGFLTGDYVEIIEYDSELNARIAVRSSAPISDINYIEDGLISFTIEEPQEKVNECRIVLPTILLDGDPIVLIDNKEVQSSGVVDYGGMNSSDVYVIHFEYPNGSSYVVIGGSNTIPELSSGRGFLFGVTIALIATILITRQVRKIKQQR